jgi:hypothetical protein
VSPLCVFAARFGHRCIRLSVCLSAWLSIYLFISLSVPSDISSILLQIEKNQNDFIPAKWQLRRPATTAATTTTIAFTPLKMGLQNRWIEDYQPSDEHRDDDDDRAQK